MKPQLVFDLPTSINKMYEPKGYRTVLSEAAKIWKEYAQLMARSQWADDPLEGELVVYCYFYGSRLDADNGIKILFDSMNKICYLDDSQISEFHVYVSREKTEDRRVEVEIRKKEGKW